MSENQARRSSPPRRTRARCAWAAALLLAGCAPLNGCAEPVSAGRAGPAGLWTHADPAGATSVPFVDADIVVFNTVTDTRVVALDAATGARRWEVRLELPAELRGRGFPPARLVGTGEVVVVPAWDLYGLDRNTGRVRWKLAPPDDFPGTGVALGEDGFLYATGHHLYRVDPATGAVLWRSDLGEQPFAPVEREGVVYVGTRGVIPGSSGVLGAGHAAAVEASSGRVLWRTPVPAPEDPALGGVTGAGALTPELYLVSSPNRRVYALDRKTGRVRWETRGSGPYGAGVVVVGGVAVTAGDAGLLDAFELATGRQSWSLSVGSSVTDPLASMGDRVLVANGRLQAVDAGGRAAWGYGGAGWRQPVVSTGAGVLADRVYVGTEKGLSALAAPR